MRVLFSLWQVLAGTELGVARKGKRHKSGEDVYEDCRTFLITSLSSPAPQIDVTQSSRTASHSGVTLIFVFLITLLA